MRPIEPLETRRLLTAFTASSVAELIGDINAANAAGGENTITLAPGASLDGVGFNSTWDSFTNSKPVNFRINNRRCATG